MTASNDRRRHSRHTLRGRLLRLLLGVALLAPGLALQTPPLPVRADDLSDAIAEQQRLAKLIAQQKAQLAKIQAQQAALASQIAATRKNLAEVRTSIEEDESQIAAIKGQMVLVKAHYESLAAEQALLEARLAQLTNEQNAMQRELEVRQQILAARLAAAYEADQTPILQQILTAHSLTEAISDVSYYGALSQADKALAEEIKRDQKALAQIRETVEMASAANAELKDQVDAERHRLDDAQAQLTAAEQQLADLKAMMEKQLAEQQAADAKLVANKVALAAAIRSNGAAMDQLAARIDQIIAQQGGGGAKIPSEYSGTLSWPMGGRITQEFGCTGVAGEPRVGSCYHFHQGIDIAAPCRTPVHAAGAGVVVFVGYNPYDAPPRAWLVIVAHSTSMVTWYAHMTGAAPPGIYVGAQVAAGQLVGTENTTGHSTGCHLHWAVRVNGVFMNPRMFA
jgi:murein DD-endopeptidase MepM/ murein hydrolase activator NlpD